MSRRRSGVDAACPRGKQDQRRGERERDISRERGAEVAENLYVDQDLFFEISALEGTGFDHMFETIVRKLQQSRQGATGQSATLSLKSSTEKGGRGNSDCAC